MTKLALTAAFAILSLTGLAAVPAFAATHTSANFCLDATSVDPADEADTVVQDLNAKGVRATSVEAWNGCIRAYITDKDGRQSMALFDPQTLQQVGDLGRS